ncbi:MAG: carbon starvation protein A [Candidatus Omnitrophica bacterium]|nr:carbon starvation protein A [Candidatus Omnitrophota bacterium]
MNSLLVAAIAIVFLTLGYIFYSKKFVKLFGISAKAVTPAHKNYDGVDYVPAKNPLVLFGHHFSSISGAAPIIGPILALSIWGWGPTIIWIIIGSIFIGGVHDFGSLVLSIKNSGRSISDIAENVVSRRAKLFFASFVWLTLILVIAVFVYLCAKTLAYEPKIVIPSIGLIAVAILVGYLLYNVKANHAAVTLLGVGVMALLIIIGNKFPVRIEAENPQVFWGCLLLIYSFIASITPVQILLQPRDYLSAFLLIFGVIFGYLGIIVSRPNIALPFFNGFHLVDNSLWPMLFVTVACGAISGFHSFVASGTTSKQLSSETHARGISYGGMIVEAAVAVMAVLVVAAGLKNQAALTAFLGKGGSGPVGAFGHGYGALTGSMLAGMGGFLAIVILNAFILTTLDTATRIGRYLTHELFGIKNRYLATFIVVALSGWLGLSGNWTKIWPVFGAANQLVAALALLVITVWLLSRNARIIYTILPCIFMLLTTFGALLYNIPKYLKNGDVLLGIISCALLIITVYMLFEVYVYLKKKKRYKHA